MSLLDKHLSRFAQQCEEDDGPSKEACRWARANRARFPNDKRPRKRRSLAIEVERI